jgi:hypothetical protein
MSEAKREIRICVSEGTHEKVNIRIPLGLAKVVGLGGIGKKIAEEENIDLPEIMRKIDEIEDGKIVDVVDDKGDHVEIFVETKTPVEA